MNCQQMGDCQTSCSHTFQIHCFSQFFSTTINFTGNFEFFSSLPSMSSLTHLFINSLFHQLIYSVVWQIYGSYKCSKPNCSFCILYQHSPSYALFCYLS